MKFPPKFTLKWWLLYLAMVPVVWLIGFAVFIATGLLLIEVGRLGLSANMLIFPLIIGAIFFVLWKYDGV